MGTGFGGRLRDLRESAELSQQALADRAGMPSNTVARIERDEREPGWATVLKLAAALGVTPNDFIPPPAKGRRSAGK